MSRARGCRSEMCCTRLAKNTGHKKDAKSWPSAHHRTTLSDYARYLFIYYKIVQEVQVKKEKNKNNKIIKTWYSCLTNFFLIIDTCLSCKDTARQNCVMAPRWRFLARFCILYFKQATCNTFQTCILNSR